MNAEHVAFADATVGGIHKPGGCAVLGIEDGTATVIADGTVVGHGIIWDNTEALWCCTAAAGASTTGDWTILQMNPNTQWKGGDVTWAGNHQFDASVDFSDVDITGSLLVDSSFDASHAFFDGTVIASNLEVTGSGVFDGTTDFYDEIDVSDVYLRGDITGSALGIVSMLGSYTTQDADTIDMTSAHAYLAKQDGFVAATFQGGNQGLGAACQIYVDTDTDPPTGGALISNWQDTDYHNTNTYASVGPVPIAKGQYFEVVIANITLNAIYWIPVGVLSRPEDNN